MGSRGAQLQEFRRESGWLTLLGNMKPKLRGIWLTDTPAASSTSTLKSPALFETSGFERPRESKGGVDMGWEWRGNDKKLTNTVVEVVKPLQFGEVARIFSDSAWP